MFDRLRKSEVERIAATKIAQSRTGQGKKLTPAQIVAQQCKAAGARNKRRGK